LPGAISRPALPLQTAGIEPGRRRVAFEVGAQEPPRTERSQMPLHELGRARVAATKPSTEGGQRPQVEAATIQAGPLTIQVGPTFETCLIQVEGDLDDSTRGALERELRRVERTEVDTIVLDLSGLKYLDSVGIECLLEAVERSHFNGDRLRLLRPPAEGASLLEMMDLEASLPYLD
jgi:anti-anti-sigma factor